MSAVVLPFRRPAPRSALARPGQSNALDAFEKLLAAQIIIERMNAARETRTVHDFALLMLALVSEMEVRDAKESMPAWYNAVTILLRAGGLKC